MEGNKKIGEWYISNFDDELGYEINEEATFSTVMNAMRNGDEFYALIGVADSLVRERIFEELARIYADNKYGEIYNLWLNGRNNDSDIPDCRGVNIANANVIIDNIDDFDFILMVMGMIKNRNPTMFQTIIRLIDK